MAVQKKIEIVSHPQICRRKHLRVETSYGYHNTFTNSTNIAINPFHYLIIKLHVPNVFNSNCFVTEKVNNKISLRLKTNPQLLEDPQDWLPEIT